MSRRMLSVYLSDETYQMLDAYCKKVSLTKSGYIANLIQTNLDFNQLVMSKLTNDQMIDLISKVSNKG